MLKYEEDGSIKVVKNLDEKTEDKLKIQIHLLNLQAYTSICLNNLQQIIHRAWHFTQKSIKNHINEVNGFWVIRVYSSWSKKKNSAVMF